MTKRALIYARVSTEEQAKQGFSIPAQIKTCRKYTEENKLTLVKTFSDKGQTGTAIDRPEFQKLLNYCEEDDISHVVVYQTDRLARNETDHFLIKRKFKQLNIKLHSVAQPMINESPEGRLVDTVMAGVNAFYSRDLGRKAKKGMVQKFEEGWYPGWAPLGYINTENEETNKKIVKQNSEKAELVKKAFKLYATGNYSVLSLARKMNKLGLKSRTGKKLSHSTMHGILSNPFYWGLMRWDGKEKIGKHKPLINKELFDRCQEILAKNRNYTKRQRKYNFLLRGVVWCEDHNRRLVAEWHHDINSKKRDKIGYYHCAEPGGCKGSYVEIRTLEQNTSKLLKELEFKDEFIQKVIQQVKAYLSKIRQNNKSKKIKFTKKINVLESKSDKLVDLLLEEEIDKEIHKRKQSQIKQKIENLEEKKRNLRLEKSIDINLIEEVLGLSKNIYKSYQEAPKELKQKYLRFFFNKVYVKDKKISKVRYNPLFETLLEEEEVILKTEWLPGLDLNQ